MSFPWRGTEAQVFLGGLQVSGAGNLSDFRGGEVERV